MGSSYERLPELVRWILLVPLTLLFTVLIGGIIVIIRDDAVIVQPLFTMLAAMVAAHTLAPRAKRHIGSAASTLNYIISNP